MGESSEMVEGRSRGGDISNGGFWRGRSQRIFNSICFGMFKTLKSPLLRSRLF